MEELWYKNRTAILQLAKLLKGSKIFINWAFMDVLRRKRKEYMGSEVLLGQKIHFQ